MTKHKDKMTLDELSAIRSQCEDTFIRCSSIASVATSGVASILREHKQIILNDDMYEELSYGLEFAYQDLAEATKQYHKSMSEERAGFMANSQETPKQALEDLSLSKEALEDALLNKMLDLSEEQINELPLTTLLTIARYCENRARYWSKKLETA
jgi:hypothetical protein